MVNVDERRVGMRVSRLFVPEWKCIHFLCLGWAFVVQMSSTVPWRGIESIHCRLALVVDRLGTIEKSHCGGRLRNWSESMMAALV